MIPGAYAVFVLVRLNDIMLDSSIAWIPKISRFIREHSRFERDRRRASPIIRGGWKRQDKGNVGVDKTCDGPDRYSFSM